MPASTFFPAPTAKRAEVMEKSLIGAAPGFDDPIALLRACHIRIQQRCGLLDRIIEHLAAHGADEQARGACRQILHYFNTAGIHHHADEEENLFPAMLSACSPQRRKSIARVIDDLNDEHVLMAAAWRALEPQLRAIEAGESAALNAAVVARFQRAYLDHIDKEETQAFDVAQRILDAATLEKIGRSMAARRGAEYPLG